MATVLRENIGKLTDKLTVTLSKDDYLPAFEQSLKKYAKTANIPGFRKGMVPAGMIKKMYGSSVFVEEIIRTVERELNKYMDEEKLDLLAQPMPLESDSRQLNMNNPSDYAFAFEIGLKPAIDIDVKNITVTRNKVNVTDEMIDEEIKRLKLQHGKMTDPEEITVEENVLNVTFSECYEDGSEIADGLSKGNSLLVKYFTVPFRQQLMGKKKDDTIVLQLKDAFDKKERDWIISDLGLTNEYEAAEQKSFKMTITKVGLIEKAQMDENFFLAVYPDMVLVNEDDFRTNIKNDIQASYDQQSSIQLQDQIFHHLADHTHLEFPEKFLKKMMQQGKEQQKTAEEAEIEYPAFASSLQWSLISTQLTNQYQIRVSLDEIKQFAKQQITSYMGGQNVADAPWLDSYAESMLKDKKFIENTSNQLKASKLFNILEGQVSVNENMVTPEELAALQHNHAH